MVVAGAVAVTTLPFAAAGGVLGGIARPNFMTFETPRFTEKKAGPCPKFRGIIVCPEDGFGSKAPNGVTMTPGLFRSVAKAGRSVKKVSPLVSCPVMILKGGPELAMIKVFTLKPEAV